MLHRALGLHLLLITGAFADCYTDALDRITNVVAVKFSYTDTKIRNQSKPQPIKTITPPPRKPQLEVMIVSERWAVWRLLKGP